MKNHDGKLAGVLGTVIIHLLAAILFMSFKISELKKDITNKFEIEIVSEEKSTSTTEKQIELPVSGIDRILKGDNEMLNIARNLANKPEVKINPADYIDQVKNELIKSGKLGVDNYIDEQKKANNNTESEKIESSNDTASKNQEEKLRKSLRMEANYSGPTRIYYNLPGRNHAYLPIPIYKCQGSGKIVLSIEVDQEGNVEKASVKVGESTTTDQCLLETAVETALISRFNPDVNAPKIQTGTLSYHFVAQ
jgi:hypothetical protein